MGKSLVIVESPAKAKTINKYLGSQYVVKSSIGHIRDLPTSGSSSSKEPAAKGRKSASEAPALSPWWISPPSVPVPLSLTLESRS